MGLGLGASLAPSDAGGSEAWAGSSIEAEAHITGAGWQGLGGAARQVPYQPRHYSPVVAAPGPHLDAGAELRPAGRLLAQLAAGMAEQPRVCSMAGVLTPPWGLPAAPQPASGGVPTGEAPAAVAATAQQQHWAVPAWRSAAPAQHAALIHASTHLVSKTNNYAHRS